MRWLGLASVKPLVGVVLFPSVRKLLGDMGPTVADAFVGASDGVWAFVDGEVGDFIGADWTLVNTSSHVRNI